MRIVPRTPKAGSSFVARMIGVGVGVGVDDEDEVGVAVTVTFNTTGMVVVRGKSRPPVRV